VPVATASASGTHPDFLFVVGGYIAAVLIASGVVVTALATTAGGTNSAIFSFFFMGCAYTFAYAFPGFIVTVVIARCFHLRAWLFFIIAGGLDGIVALWIFDRPRPRDDFTLMVVAGGMAGGLVYRLIAYRRRSAPG
jgi:hypothetical protein